METAQERQPDWAVSVSTLFYFLRDPPGYEQPTLRLDRGALHLEARYNYEELRTASLWAGATFSGGGKLGWTITPMIAGVLGATAGIAPGYEGALTWWKLELYSESEYVFAWRPTGSSFLYNWSELTLAPLDGFRFGLVTQRTRAHASARELSAGPLVGVSYRQSNITFYALDLDTSERIFIVALGLDFGS